MLTLKRVLYVLSALAILLAGGSLLLPSQAVVSRSISIASPPDRVFALVGDLRRFHEFSPEADLDPKIRYAFEGTESGLGQTMVWRSDHPDVGSGTRTVSFYEPQSRVELLVVRGRRDRAAVDFALTPTATGTDVTWSHMTSFKGIPARWSGLLAERRIGAELEQGLEKLKAAAERS